MTPVPTRLLAIAADEPDRVAVVVVTPEGRDFAEHRVTIGEWLGRAIATADRLRDEGVAPGDRVLISMPPSIDFLAAFFGAQWLGAIPVPLPAMTSTSRAKVYLERLRSVASDAAPAAILANDKTAATIREHRVSSAGRIVEGIESTVAPLRAPASVADGDTAFIQYTSGSTGRPKGVMVTHGNLVANVDGSVRAAAFDADDRFLSWLPVYHDLGLIGGIIVPTTIGAVAHLMPPESFPLDPSSWLRAITRYAATIIMAPNFAYSLVGRRLRDADFEGVDLSSVRLAFNGAEPVDLATAEAFIGRAEAHGFRPSSYYPVYGLAETTLSATFPPVGRGLRIDHVRREDVARGATLSPVSGPGPDIISSLSVGSPFEGHELTIEEPQTDEQSGEQPGEQPGEQLGEQLGERRLGEIVLSGPSVSPGYFSADDDDRAPRRRLRTGDLGYLADGELYVVDRLKDLVIVAGACYAPSDIEQVVESVPGIRMGRSVAWSRRREQEGTDSLMIVAEARLGLRRGASAIEREIRRAVSERIGLVPEDILLVRPRTLTVTSSGKLMRADARDKHRDGTLETCRALAPLHPLALLAEARRLWSYKATILSRWRSN